MNVSDVIELTQCSDSRVSLEASSYLAALQRSVYEESKQREESDEEET